MEQEIRIEKKNHRLNVTVYPDFVEVTVFMSDDDYFNVTLNSSRMSSTARAEYERTALRDFAKSIFNGNVAYQRIFSSALEMYEYKDRFGIKVPNNNGNEWFKKVCFDISAQNTGKSILAYIGKKSDEFAKKR